MVIHFENRSAAINHLVSSGWREISNGNFVSKDGTCAADITPAHGDVVRVYFWEVSQAA